MNQENGKLLEEPINQILIPRLHERKIYHPKKYNNYHNFLGNKRASNNESESKKYIFENNINKKYNIFFFR